MSSDSSANKDPVEDRIADFRDYEKDLLEKIALCPKCAQRERLKWELAHFYLGTARPEMAISPLRKIVESTTEEKIRQDAIEVLRNMSGADGKEVSCPDDITDLKGLLWEMANGYLRQGNRSSTVLCLLRVLDISEDRELRAKCFLLLGSAMEEEGLLDAAIKIYRQGLDCAPRDVDARYFLNNNLGYCLNLGSEYPSAERYCTEAIRILPERHNAHKNLGLSMKGQCRYRDASESLIRATILCPADPRAYEELENIVANHWDEEEGISEIIDRIASLKILIDQARQKPSIH